MVKVIAITSETSLCECCGKNNLKRVVVLDVNGDIRRYGTDCAARALGKKVANDISAMIEIKAYISKWEVKYTGDIVAKGICNKLGYSAQYKDGQYHIHGLGVL